MPLTALQRQVAKLQADADTLARQQDTIDAKKQRNILAKKRLAAQVRDMEIVRLGTLAYDAGLKGMDAARLVEGFARLVAGDIEAP